MDHQKSEREKFEDWVRKSITELQGGFYYLNEQIKGLKDERSTTNKRKSKKTDRTAN